MATQVRREDVTTLLDNITATGQTFAVACKRRTDLVLRYRPTEQYKSGRLAYVGDCSDIATREFVSVGRGGEKIIIEPAGTLRWMQLTKPTLNPSKHWVSKGGSLSFDPAEKKLYHVKGFYNDSEKAADGRIGRHDDWRAWAFICLRTVERIKAHGQEYAVVD